MAYNWPQVAVLLCGIYTILTNFRVYDISKMFLKYQPK